MSLQAKLTISFLITTMLLFAVNIFMFINIHHKVTNMDKVYQGNLKMNELGLTIDEVQTNLEDYLNTKTTESLENYYRSEQKLYNLVYDLNDEVTSNELLRMERNIRFLSKSYMDMTGETIEAKRGRLVEKYNDCFDKTVFLYEFIKNNIYSLNNELFNTNNINYEELSISVRSLEFSSISVLVLVGIANIIFMYILANTITTPLKRLALTADEVSNGNLEVELLPVRSNDEVGVLTRAFNSMVVSIRNYVQQIRDNMENERLLKEHEHMMETNLKEARLKYLQAQINPHFLFNTLNAGAQLAMMEDADKTYEYIQNVADFFRYNVKKEYETVHLYEEIELVDHYIYILNVRFSGKIGYEKKIDSNYCDYKLPSMILQPLVENSFKYGIRDLEYPGKITISVYAIDGRICITVEDNGVGMTKEKIAEIMSGREEESFDPTLGKAAEKTNGVGINNVIRRLRLFLGRDDCFEISSEGLGKGTKVRIYLPIEGEE